MALWLLNIARVTLHSQAVLELNTAWTPRDNNFLCSLGFHENSGETCHWMRRMQQHVKWFRLCYITECRADVVFPATLHNALQRCDRSPPEETRATSTSECLTPSITSLVTSRLASYSRRFIEAAHTIIS
eukprot:gb/GECG01014334.1/.p1 GENE.gb/GECG01014334.1/~~gb/GECG01014334.1/.p1  ORF type:complete len:130 (+),score=4.33 gb/GECG01014334.1/:1-390(+)